MDVLIEVILTLGDFIGGFVLMRSLTEAEMEANKYTSPTALFMSDGGCSDRGYTYRRRFHGRLLAEAG